MINRTGAPPQPATGTPRPPGTRTYRGPFATMTILFFMWGFMCFWNDILIPRFKEAFGLNRYQAMLVHLAFFGTHSTGGPADTP